MQHLLSRPRLVRAATAAGLLLLAGWACAGAAGAAPFATDPVEALRLYLRQDEKAARTPEVLAARKAILEKKAAAVRSIGDLARALTLQEWGGAGLDPDLNDVWLSMGDRYERDIKAALTKGDSTTRQATAHLLSELSVQVRKGGVETQRLGTLLPHFAPELIALTRADDDAVAVAATQALGLINPDADKAVPALRQVLASGSAELRRAAADALLNLIRVSGEIVKKVQGEERRRQALDAQIKTDRAAFLAAVAGVGDSDAQVRRSSLEAMQQAGSTLEDRIIIPPPDTLNFPPPERNVWSEEEVTRAKAYKDEVAAGKAELQPLLDAFREGTPTLARAQSDPDTAVRLRARMAADAIATARSKLKQWEATVPVIPKAAEKKEEDKKEDKKEGETRQDPAPGDDLQLVRADVPAAEEQAPADGERQLVEALAQGLFDPDVRNRLGAVDALEDIGPAAAPAAPALVKALCDPDKFVRWSAARTLGKLAPADAGPAVRGLTELVCFPDLDVQLAALNALTAYGPLAEEAVPTLAKAVVNVKFDADVRVGAIRALEGVGTAAAPAIPALITALTEGTDRVRRAAALLLGKFGPAAREALPALRNALNDRDPDTRRFASEAILNIDRP
jgi:HEAT repeat protein